MKPIIKVEGLSKQYRIGVRQESFATLRDAIAGVVRAPLNRLRRNGHSANNTIWALKDVGFEVAPGEALGIIGRNGAGKSTLLKILSRITDPTAGQVELYGRVGSLLEVGTGFHPELTGRENIFLNGAVMGMRREETSQRFDEIVAFSEIERFIDTPVKRYSTGMYMRLAFAVAAHLNPEILIVDEVLAVGDASFQKKCLGKMGDVANEGRTVLFVSHNMATIQSLCNSCLLIKNGRLEAQGDPAQMLALYTEAELRPGSGIQSLAAHPGRRSHSTPLMKVVSLFSESEEPASAVRMGAPLSVRLEFSASSPVRPVLGLTVKTVEGAPVFGVSNRWTHQGADGPATAEGMILCNVQRLPLNPGTYSLDLYFGDFADSTRELDIVIDAISFEVFPTDLYGTGMLPPARLVGPVFCSATWKLN